jgi:DNA-binding CsgD family transcriptional regulator
MGRVKKSLPGESPTHGFLVHPKLFVFFEKKTGTKRFEVKADKDGGMPMEQAVSLLAIHCVARQQTPRDFGVLVAAGEDLVEAIAGRAIELMGTCSGPRVPGFPLSRRQREVLTSVAQNLSNKEIAAKLNVSVRTIKFHVSILLEKFEVRGRVDLMLEAAGFLPADSIHKRNGNSEAIKTTALEDAQAAAPVDQRAKLMLAPPLARSMGR